MPKGDGHICAIIPGLVQRDSRTQFLYQSHQTRRPRELTELLATKAIHGQPTGARAGIGGREATTEDHRALGSVQKTGCLRIMALADPEQMKDLRIEC